jgi:hypothetical protein
VRDKDGSQLIVVNNLARLQHNNVISHSFKIRRDMRGEQDRTIAGDGNVQQRGKKLTPSRRIEAGIFR